VTVGRSNDPAGFQPPVNHIKIARYIPQSLLLPRCDAVIFHGGFNTLLSALWYGLPLVVIPQEAGDQFPTAQRCAEAGVGVMVTAAPPSPAAVRAAVKTVLTQPDYRTRALQFQSELQALSPLREAVRRLETLVKTGEPQLDQTGIVCEP
jgi:UDP:flavonoid glycosyltransferase YjiC (YdhE family)